MSPAGKWQREREACAMVPPTAPPSLRPDHVNARAWQEQDGPENRASSGRCDIPHLAPLMGACCLWRRKKSDKRPGEV